MTLSTFLNIVNPNQDTVLDEPLAYEYSFPLDKFQKHAIKAINRDENVLVTAKTGSGKKDISRRVSDLSLFGKK